MAPKSLIGRDKGVPSKARVKAAEAVSTVTKAEALKLEESYPGFRFRAPAPADRAHAFSDGQVCIYLRHLRDGMKLPLQPHLVDFLKFFGLVPAQLSPNAMIYLHGLRDMLASQMQWSMENVMALVRVCSSEPGVYYLKPANASAFGFTGTPDSIHGWKEKFIFVSTEGDWGFPTIPRVTRGPVLRVWPGSTEEVDALYTRLGCKYICLDLNKGGLIPYKEAPVAARGGKRKLEEDEAPQVSPLSRRRKSTRGLKPTEVLAEVEERASESTPSAEEQQRTGSTAEDGSSSDAAEEAEVETMEEGTPPNAGGDAEVGSEEEEAASSDSSSGSAEDSSEAEEGEVVIKSSRCWFKNGVCTFKVDKGADNLPKSNPDGLFHEVMSALLLPKDRAALNELPRSEAIKLQNQLAAQSALVANHLQLLASEVESDLGNRLGEKTKATAEAEDRAKTAEDEVARLELSSKAEAEREKKEAEKTRSQLNDLEGQVKELMARVEADRAEASAAATVHDATVAALKAESGLILLKKDEAEEARAKAEAEVATLSKRWKEEVLTFNQSRKNLEREVAMLKADLGEEKKKAEVAMAASVLVAEALKKQLEDKAAETAPTTTATEAAEAYKSSMEFDELKVELGEFGFDLLKQELIDQKLLTAEALDPLTFLKSVAKLTED